MNNKVRYIKSGRVPVARRAIPTNGNGVAPEGSGDVRKIVENGYELFRRRKWLIVAVFTAVIVASVVYVLRKDPEYQAQSVIIVEEQKYDPTNALSLGYISGLDNSSTTMHLMVLGQSTSLAERVADRILELQTVPETTEPFSVIEEGVTRTGMARQIQLGRMTVASTTPNVINIKATAPSAREAAVLANLFAEEAIAQSREISRRRVSASREFLEQRLNEGRELLESTEETFEDYLSREGTVALDQEVQSAIANLARLEVAQSEAQIELEMRQASIQSTESELEKIRPMLTQRVASGVDREIATSQERLAELELRLEQIYHTYPNLRENPEADSRIPRLRSEITQLKERVRVLSEQYVEEVLGAGGVGAEKPESGVAYVASLERQLVTDRIAASGLQSKIAALSRQKEQLDGRLKQAPKQTVEIAQLQRARASSEQLYSYLERKLQEAQLAEESETGSLRILRAAEVPLSPVSPRPEKIFPLAVLLGLLVSVGAAALSTKLDRRLYTPTEVTKSGFHLLGVVPDMRRLIREEFNGARTMNVQGNAVASNMVALLAPHTAAAEAYRHLYARIRLEAGAARAKTVIVTSPEASVGKSTTALNLALTAASARHRTLIIDVDLRRPAIERYLGINTGVTLQDILELGEGADAATYVARNAVTGIHNLRAITVQEPILNPLEHLVSPRLRNLAEQLKEHFDLIIFDAPPLLLTPDAALLAPLCDEVVVVVAAGATDSEALHQIEVELAECNAHLAGIVLNRFDASNRVFRSTYGYLQHNYSGYYTRAAS